jgi:hypothetical protein
MSHHDELPSIDPSTLGDVTGGVTSTASASSGSNAQLTAALQGITSQIASLGQNNNSSSSSSLQSLLPMMMLLGRGGGGGGGACPCGCGMANCMRR